MTSPNCEILLASSINGRLDILSNDLNFAMINSNTSQNKKALIERSL